MKIPLFLVSVFAATGCLLAQSDANKAQVTGVVYDANHSAVPGAGIAILHLGTGLTRRVTSASDGRYRANLLDAGSYEITATGPGFASSKVEGIVVTVGASLIVNIVLQTQSTTTRVEGGNAIISATQPAPSTTVNAAAIASLPINGRRFHDFATLTPTVQIETQRGQISFAGQRGINSNVMLDGADYNQPFYGGIRGGERSNFIITVPQTAIQEFQVIATGYSAEYGRSTGGVLNTITKSGANDIHGEAFYQMRHKELGAMDPVQLMYSLETLQQWGGSIGGPLRKERLFLFGGFERQDSRTPRQVQFPALITAAPSPAAQEAFDFLKSLERPFPQTNDATAFTLRADHQTQSGNRLSLRYNFSDARAINAVSAGGALSPFTNRSISNDGIEADRTHTGTLQYTRIFSPNLVNDLRFGGTYERRPRASNSGSPQVTIGSATVGTFGGRNFLPSMQDDRRMQFADAFSFGRGAHSLKIGVDYNRLSATQIQGLNQFGAFSIAGANVTALLDILSTGGAVSNRFDDPSVTYDRQIGNLYGSLSMTQAAAFFQDNWRIHRKLTLDLGLRWEGQYNPQPEANNRALLDLIGGFRFPNGATLNPQTIRNNTRQFMPRLGVAWIPFSSSPRTVIRGHMGLFYASTPLTTMAGPLNNLRMPPGDVSIRLAPSGGNTVYDQLLQVGIDLDRFSLDRLPVIPVEKVQQAAALAAGGNAPNPFAGAALTLMPQDFSNPRSYQAGLAAEREVVRNFLVRFQLNYVNTVHLNRNRDYNVPAPFFRTGDASLRPNYGLRTMSARRPLASLGSITVRESSARSMYRGATLSVQYRARALQFGAHYTHSEAFSDDDGERDATLFNYDDGNNLRAGYGYSRLDMRRQFTGWFLWSGPFGFDVSAAVRARSGLPVNPVTGVDSNEDLSTSDRPYAAPGVPIARNSFRNRKVIGNDLRVLRSFRIRGSEARMLQFSAEFFNLLNLDNVVYSGVNGGMNGGTYGPGINSSGAAIPVDIRFLRLRNADGSYDRINAQTGTPLQVQLGIRFLF